MLDSIKQRYKSGDKALITNTAASVTVLLGLVSPVAGHEILTVGLFALSGSVTNSLAIHMLFEKVPLMYGSGVIPNRFEEFKAVIRNMIMTQFFNDENLKRFIADEEATISTWLKPGQLIDEIDYDKLFERLVEAIMSSSFGGMLEMMGGASALEGLKDSFIEKIKFTLNEMVESESFQAGVANSIDTEKLSGDMAVKIQSIVDRRLEELTPTIVKEIVQEMIKEHLGWLVVWGGVVGGFIGLAAGVLI